MKKKVTFLTLCQSLGTLRKKRSYVRGFEVPSLEACRGVTSARCDVPVSYFVHLSFRRSFPLSRPHVESRPG